MPDYLLNVEEAARYLGVSIPALRSWLYARKIRYAKIGKLIRFRKKWLDGFVTRNIRGEEPARRSWQERSPGSTRDLPNSAKARRRGKTGVQEHKIHRS